MPTACLHLCLYPPLCLTQVDADFDVSGKANEAARAAAEAARKVNEAAEDADSKFQFRRKGRILWSDLKRSAPLVRATAGRSWAGQGCSGRGPHGEGKGRSGAHVAVKRYHTCGRPLLICCPPCPGPPRSGVAAYATSLRPRWARSHSCSCSSSRVRWGWLWLRPAMWGRSGRYKMWQRAVWGSMYGRGGLAMLGASSSSSSSCASCFD